jgi:predicted nucleic acid-binding protein
MWSVIDKPGLLDTNVFVHAHARDSATQECRLFLMGLEAGRVRARIEPIVLHELSYALPHYLKQMERADVAAYLLMVLAWDAVEGDKAIMIEAVERWRDTDGLSFADAFLAALATQHGRPIYSKNVRELRAQGAEVPSPLPGP